MAEKFPEINKHLNSTISIGATCINHKALNLLKISRALFIYL